MSRSSGWSTARLDDLAVVARGRSRHRPRNAPHLYGGPYPFVQTGEVKASDFWIYGTRQSYSEDGLAQSRLWPVGTVCVTIAANIAESGMLAVEACFPDSIIGLTPRSGVSDASFLKYSIDYMKMRLRTVSGGTTQDNLSLEKLLSFAFPAPPLHAQLLVGRCLRAFDDLIENNRRRIEILEEMARLLYREWFVHFRFPGHEDVELVNSELGPVPDGWAVTTVSEAVELNPKLKVDKTLEYPFLTMGDLSESGMVCFPSERKKGSSGTRFQNGDTLFARITPCLENGKTGFVQTLEPGQIGRGSTEFVVFRGRVIGSEHTYLLARDCRLREVAQRSMTGASGRQRVKNECFDSFFIAVPPEVISDAFGKLVRPMFDLVGNLATQNRVLRETRDLLLPRLVSGELDVSDLNLDGVLQ